MIGTIPQSDSAVSPIASSLLEEANGAMEEPAEFAQTHSFREKALPDRSGTSPCSADNEVTVVSPRED